MANKATASTPLEAAPADLRAPEAWADLVFPVSPRGTQHADRWRHAVASHVHRWELHAYHQGAPLLLSREDYTAALDAATASPSTTHRPALGQD
jgi:hypothetical protein